MRQEKDQLNINSFNFLRFLFAFIVLCDHFMILSGLPYSLPISSSVAVEGFFIISGFLIFKSYHQQPHVVKYFKKRAQRILPAYFLVVIFMAFFCVMLSNNSFFNYFFSSSQWIKYTVSNLLFCNFIAPTLPGVFGNNPLPFVNGSLWTIKIEISFYLIVPLIFLLYKKWNSIWMFILLYFISILYAIGMEYVFSQHSVLIFHQLARQFVGQLSYFLAGGIIFLYYDWFQRKLKLLFVISILIYALFIYQNSLIFNFIQPIALAIIVIFFAYNLSFVNNFGKYGDFSYGLYLFHFPIIQMIVNYNIEGNNMVLKFAYAFLFTLITAILSWHLVEKRFLHSRIILSSV